MFLISAHVLGEGYLSLGIIVLFQTIFVNLMLNSPKILYRYRKFAVLFRHYPLFPTGKTNGLILQIRTKLKLIAN